MVYHGPSTACSACKERRVKCDKGRPACQNCVKRNRICPGYADIFDRVHRDQNAIVVRKARHGQRTSNSSPSGSASSAELAPWIDATSSRSPSEEDLTLIGPTLNWFMRNTDLPPVVLNDYKLSCVDFFVTNYVNAISEPYIGDGFLYQILPVVANAPLQSPVHDAITAVSVAIVNLWTTRGLDTPCARACYARAVRSLREAIQDPSESLTDHVLMSAILLDFHEALQAQFSPTPVTDDTHKLGALALIEKRGLENYKSDISKSLLLTSRGGMVIRSIHKRVPLPASSLQWYQHPEISKTPELDVNSLGTEVATFLAMVEQTLSTSSPPGCETTFIEQMLSIGFDLDKQFVRWHETFSVESNCVVLTGREIPASIHAAGVYRNRCSVYRNLPISETVNTWRSRRIILLRTIHRCLLTLPGTVQAFFADVHAQVLADIQAMADGICDSIPFHLGDTAATLYPPEWKNVTFPKAMHNGRPMPEAEHSRYACAAGGWFLRMPLLTLMGQAFEEVDGEDLPLRHGQMDWIRAQALRLQTVWDFRKGTLYNNFA